MGWHTDHLTLAVKVDKDQKVKAPTDDFAALVQPREQHPIPWVLRDLLNPAEQRNVDARDIAPPLLNRSQYFQWP